MPRLVVLVLLALTLPARADELTLADLEDTAKRLVARSVPSHDNAMRARDVFAQLHDSIAHPAFDRMTAARSEVDAAKVSFDEAVAARDLRSAEKRVEELEAAGKALDDQLSAYVASSSDAVQKIQLGLGIIAFIVCGIVALLVRAATTRRRANR